MYDTPVITEQPSHYRHIETMSAGEIIKAINREDATVPQAVEKALPQIEALIKEIVKKLKAGGRLFYIGAGTSGRVAITDASECPPTFGVAETMVTAIIAGGPVALTKAVEFAEDNVVQGWIDLQDQGVSSKDIVIGISASGRTPYVAKAMEQCRNHNIVTGCVVCSHDSTIASVVTHAVTVIAGPEFITGSTRMKAGTAQKMVLNMISTAVMIQLGRVEDNKMVNMSLSNNKLIDRGVRMIMDKLPLSDYAEAKKMLLFHGSVKKVVENFEGR